MSWNARQDLMGLMRDGIDLTLKLDGDAGGCATWVVDALVEWLRDNWERLEDECDALGDGFPQHDLKYLADLLSKEE